jgi:DNA-binding MarR family transcriptional regulator
MTTAGSERLDTSAVDHLFGFQLSIAAAQARKVFHRQVGEPFELRTVEFTLLMVLLRNARVSPKQLARALAMTAPAITVLIDKMAARGLVERRRSSTDGRALEVLLTAEGEALARAAHGKSLSMEDGLLQRLSPGERVMLRELLVKFWGAAGA